MTINFHTSLVPQFRANTQEIINYLGANLDCQIYLATQSKEFLQELEAHKYNHVEILESNECNLTRGLQVGNKIILTEFELFNRQPVTHAKNKSHKNSKKLDLNSEFVPVDLDNILPGDCLVHIKHGIGKFIELKQIEWDGQHREYISIEFAKGEILNIPVEQMNLLSVYKGLDNPKLSRLGSASWERAKSNARASVQKVAEGLVELYAERETKAGDAMSPDTPWQVEL